MAPESSPSIEASGPDRVPPRPQLRERIHLLAESLPFEHPGLAAVVALVIVGVAGFALLRPAPDPVELTLPRAGVDAPDTGASLDPDTSESARLVVHAAGAIHRPGVYELDAGSRVADLLEAAGGTLPEADLDSLNLAAVLSDGEKVLVLRRGEATPTPAGAGGAETSRAKVNLNTASAAELDALPGIGPATAEAIIRHREQRGRFRSVSDLLDVRGIGEAKLSQLRPLVTV